MKLTYYLRDNGACGYYRVSLPLHTWARNDPGVNLCEVTQGCSRDRVHTSLGADVTLVPRVSESVLLEVLRELQKEGKKFILDHDDNMFGVSPLSPHYADFGLEEVSIRIGEEIKPVWTDGENINLEMNRGRVKGLERACERADMITVTTGYLKHLYDRYNDNVKVLPNCVDLKIWKPLPLKERDDIRLCWFGGHSHYEDWYTVKDAIRAVMGRYPKARLVLMGAKWDKTLEGISPERVEYHTWVQTPAYPHKAAILDGDIAVIPLRDTPFNRCKSPIKWIEFASLEVPAVTTLIPPYSYVAEEDNGIFIEENNIDAWVEGISYLIDNEDKRREMGKLARRYVEENYDINSQWTMWRDTYTELLGGW